MSEGFAERLDTIRRDAIVKAEAALEAQGFQRNGDGAWHGTLHLGQYGLIPARVQLPPGFPDALPDIFIEPQTLSRSVPHIEYSGRICIAPRTGTLLDAGQPQGLITEALERAANTLTTGLSGANTDDFSDEFAAYWADENTSAVWSIYDPVGSARQIACFWLRPGGSAPTRQRLFASSRKAARTWAHRTGWRTERALPAFCVPLTAPFPPPEPDHPLCFLDIQRLVQQHALPETYAALMAWLRTVSLPIALLLALPLQGEQGAALVGVDVETPRGAAAYQAQRGFRTGKAPAAHTLRFQSDQPVKRLLIERLDMAYVLPRGGANTALSTRTIMVIGCGAVGSHVVSHLAALGVGQLRLVDPERLSSANIHRHVLGVSYLGFTKAHGLAIEIGSRFPHLAVDYRAKRIEDVLQEEPAFITEADLVVVAIGDPTVELRLNDLFGAQMRRLHAWIEPLGIGGHVLATGVTPGPGCYHCLYVHDATLGLVNLASFAAPGQPFQRTMGGCAGQFVPFAALDADRIAGEAARLASQILSGEERENVLISVREDERALRDAGYTLAPRARIVAAGTRCRETRHARIDCPTCSRWRQ